MARDLAACSDDGDVPDDGHDVIDSDSDDCCDRPGPLLYRRPSGVAYGTSRPVMNLNPATLGDDDPGFLTPIERKQSRDAERSLLRDNHVLPPKHPERRHDGGGSWFTTMYRRLFSTKVPRRMADRVTEEDDEEDDEEAQNRTADQTPAPQIKVQRPDESTPLLPGGGIAEGHGHSHEHEHLNEQWEAALAAGTLRTTWQRESKTIVVYAVPLIVTFMLQYSINVVSVFAAGRIGTLELGAVSLATMSAAITCYAPFQGLATSLDTLCAQAYGSGHRHLVGLQLQRMTCFLLLCFVPVAVMWFFAEPILNSIIPQPETARLAGQYLRVMIFSGPAFACFEAGKRFVQAQGLFRATTWVLLFAAPFNVFATWVFVFRLDYGFTGAPVAAALTQNLLPLLLLLYVRFVDGMQCWGGFSRRAFSNWGVMLRLALPGMVMLQAEYMAFEILTLCSSRFGPTHLAAQSVLTTVASISYQIPFPVSIAASTRIANLIGAGLVDAAKTTGRVSTGAAAIVGVFNLILYSSLRFRIPLLFTNDPAVIEILAETLPLIGVMQVFDSLGAGAHALLRGIGRPSVGGYANLVSYYLIALPISLGTAFGLDWKLEGLWLGVTIGLAVVSAVEYTFAAVTDWHKAAREAQIRNAAG